MIIIKIREQKGKIFRALTSKFILALLFATGAIIISFFITKLTFHKMLTTVSQLSTPNPKLQLVNTIFRDVVTLDQLQRTQAIKNHHKSYHPYLTESYQIKKNLDSLRKLSRSNELQIKQIDSLISLLKKRDNVFLNYISLRKDFLENDTLSSQLKTFAQLLNNSLSIDSSVTTTEKKIVTTTTIEEKEVAQKEKKKNFWEKLFGKKTAPEQVKVKKLIQEELNIKIDTVSTEKEDSLLLTLSNVIADKGITRENKRDLLINKQMNLHQAGNLLINRMLRMLQELENEELAATEKSNAQATFLVNTGLKKINYILIGFVIVIAILAFVFFTDLAKSNQYRKQLIASKEEAEELGKVKHRFLANMSHELRTPLQAIIGLAEQNKNKGYSTPKDNEVIYNSSQHLLQIVNEVLDYSRIVFSKFVLEEHIFNMNEVIREVIDIINIQAKEKGLVFKTPHQTFSSYYLGDAFRLKQILLNLLGNAIKFTPNGSVTLSITTKEFSKRTTFIFKIIDTGIGISKEEQEQIFYQFEQGTRVYPAHQNGTGLGLSIVKSLIELHKGSFFIESEPGKGTIFTTNLSFAKAAHNGVRDENIRDRILSNQTVWIIDDDPFILDLCKIILDKYHISNQIFSQPQEALAAPLSEKVKTIFIDIRMPVYNGSEVCRLLKEKIHHPVKIIALTAQALEEDREMIRKNGFDDLLVKPFLEKDLLQSLFKEKNNPYSDSKSSAKIAIEDSRFLKDIKAVFVEETKKDSLLFQKALHQNNEKDILYLIHKLSGRFAQMGYIDMAKSLKIIEMEIREKGYEKDLHASKIAMQLKDILKIADETSAALP